MTTLPIAQRGSCRFCDSLLEHSFVDLGMSPLCESFLTADQLNHAEDFFPLSASVCQKCFLVQLQEYVTPENIFDDYAYFSSFSDSWLRHAAKYSDEIIERLELDQNSFVVEIASNDGYLLQNFVAREIPSLGIEPAANVAAAATEKGIESLVAFFGKETATKVREERGPADLIAGNNVLAHVPDINDFVGGLKILLGEDGVVTMEFPHLWQLMKGNQFDTIYHEHFSYLSFSTTCRIFEKHGLQIFDVQELASHGGSLRIFAQHMGHARARTEAAESLLKRESEAGFDTLDHYLSFTPQVERTKRRLLAFLIEAREQGKQIAGYGAPGKGNTLLNYCGIRSDLLDYTVDRNPYKHGRFCPGTHIPIFAPDMLEETRPDYILVLPWNLKKEILEQLSFAREWGAKFIIPIPELEIVD
ncbi:MAG: hypothetical protein ACI8Y8_003268 [Planctomycetota bacterium]|jgi:hypothetical protein